MEMFTRTARPGASTSTSATIASEKSSANSGSALISAMSRRRGTASPTSCMLSIWKASPLASAPQGFVHGRATRDAGGKMGSLATVDRLSLMCDSTP
jgi:hypothetical protein